MVVMYIEIINNTKGSIESKIGDHVVWGEGGQTQLPDVHSFSEAKKLF